MHKTDFFVIRAVEMGATAAGVVPASKITVEQRLADMCESPPCPGFGSSVNCPPYVMSVIAFIEEKKKYSSVLAFKIDVPQRVLLTEDRYPISRKIHQISAAIEKEAAGKHHIPAMGLGAGSCKPLFCGERSVCPALVEKAACRHPDMARPSISGFGIHVFELAESLKWPVRKILRDTKPDPDEMGMLMGLVFLGI